jgi:acyl-CoA synthetase (NDP forming)
MPDSIHQSPLYPIINPGSIVFFGACNRFSAMGTNQLNSLPSSGFEGKIYPIHPEEKQVLDLKAYQRVKELSGVPQSPCG